MEFLETYSISEFKAEYGNIKVMAKADGSYWFKAGAIAGTVSSKLGISDITPDSVLISLVETDSGKFWLLHCNTSEVVMTL
jgi:hypothetical protein